MSDAFHRADVAVVGAGTAGAAAAALLARRGLRVILLDRGPLATAGARWVNGVPAWAFDRAGLSRPIGDELLGAGHAFHLVAGYGPQRLLIRDHGVLEVDMRLLVTRLHRLAREAGATLLGDTRVVGVERAGLRTSRGPVRADLVVDASGLSGAGLLPQPRVHPTDICAAAQEVREVADPAGARAFFAAHRTALGETLCFSSVAGGYSIVNVRCDGDRVSILTGSIPALGVPSGRQMLDRFVADNPWVGPKIFGGSRAIPLRRPFDRLTDGRVAVLGDAAAQVFPAHGSGIGVGILAAAQLADAVSGSGALHDYAADFQREYGALLASYDLFRRLSQTFAPADVAALMGHGLMDPDLARAALAQRFPTLSPAALPGKVPGLLRIPQIASRLGWVIARMPLVRALYARYPRVAPGSPELARWSRRVARVFGDRPDLGADLGPDLGPDRRPDQR